MGEQEDLEIIELLQTGIDLSRAERLASHTNRIISCLAERVILRSVKSLPFKPNLASIYHKLLKNNRNSTTVQDFQYEYLLMENIQIIIQHNDQVASSILVLDLIKHILKFNDSQAENFILYLAAESEIWLSWMYADNIITRRKCFEICRGLLTLQQQPYGYFIEQISKHLKIYFGKLVHLNNNDDVKIKKWIFDQTSTHSTEFVLNEFRDLGCIKQSIMLLVNIFTASHETSSKHFNILETLSDIVGSNEQIDIDLCLIQVFSDHDDELIDMLLNFHRLLKLQVGLDQKILVLDSVRLFLRFMSLLSFDEYTLAQMLVESPQAVEYLRQIVPLLSKTNLSKYNFLEDWNTDFESSVRITLIDLSKVLIKIKHDYSHNDEFNELIRLLQEM